MSTHTLTYDPGQMAPAEERGVRPNADLSADADMIVELIHICVRNVIDKELRRFSQAHQHDPYAEAVVARMHAQENADDLENQATAETGTVMLDAWRAGNVLQINVQGIHLIVRRQLEHWLLEERANSLIARQLATA